LKSIALILVGLGVILLGASLPPTRHLCAGKDQTRAWRILGALIVLFLLCYSAYALFLFRVTAGGPEVFVALILFGGSIFVFSVVRLTRNSIDRLRQLAETNHYRSLHDELTDLPNRTLLLGLIDQAVIRHRHNGRQFSLLLIDLNRFKEINNALGHFYGDFLIQKVANRLQNGVRSGDTLARWGGDKFAVMLPETSGQEAMAVAHKTADTMSRPFLIEGHNLSVNISIGIVTFPEHGQETEILMQHADIAMCEAQRNQLDYAAFNPAENRTSWDRLLMAGELRRAIGNNEMVLFYQPQVSVLNGSLSGVEALVRWNHAKRGMILPGEFIDLMEQNGLINAFTLLVLEQGLGQLSLWQQEGLNINLSINLSVKNLHDYEFPIIAERLLRKWRIDPARITLEITESSIMVDPGRVATVIAALKETGFQLAIDDFGTGYSSLAYLRKFPARQIKIDKSFVLDMLVNEDSAVIVKSTIDMAHNIGRQVVAEGVENHDTQVLLKRLGCDFLQGFHICHPLAAAEFRNWYIHHLNRTGTGSR
jgi:diguanylate cyclase (GGDEF)-like protein